MRLLYIEDTDSPNCAKILDQKHCPEYVQNLVPYGESEIRKISNEFRLSKRDMIRFFFQNILNKVSRVPASLHLQCSLNIIAISSSGFSQINLIAIQSRSPLLTRPISFLLFIRTIAPPLKQFNPLKYVKSWLLRGRHSAVQTKRKKWKGDILQSSPDMVRL